MTGSDHKPGQLLQKFLDGTISDEDAAELFAWLKEHPGNTTEIERELESAWENAQNEFSAIDPVRSRFLLHRLLKDIETPVRNIAPRRKIFSTLGWVAAAVLILAVLTLVLRETYTPKPVQRPVTSQKDISPGGNHAILTLDNGSSIMLDSSKNGMLTIQSEVKVLKTSDGQLAYSGKAGALAYNTLSTPRGGQYRLTLSDGTRLWLNSESSVRFPVAFEGMERRIFTTGEVYAEVAVNKSKPFYVQAGNMELRVLGTHFNINAYADEDHLRTTLLEGSIRLTNRLSRSVALLKPGQQARLKEGRLEVLNDVDLEQVMAWKNGLFSFNQLTLQETLRQIARWYNIKVEYEGKVPDLKFYGEMQRDLNLSQVLRALERTGVHFRLEQDRLIVLP